MLYLIFVKHFLCVCCVQCWTREAFSGWFSFLDGSRGAERWILQREGKFTNFDLWPQNLLPSGGITWGDVDKIYSNKITLDEVWLNLNKHLGKMESF